MPATQVISQAPAWTSFAAVSANLRMIHACPLLALLQLPCCVQPWCHARAGLAKSSIAQTAEKHGKAIGIAFYLFQARWSSACQLNGCSDFRQCCAAPHLLITAKTSTVTQHMGWAFDLRQFALPDLIVSLTFKPTILRSRP